VFLHGGSQRLTGFHDAVEKNFPGLINARVFAVNAIKVLDGYGAGYVPSSVPTHSISNDE
jgi:hypothetical protein